MRKLYIYNCSHCGITRASLESMKKFTCPHCFVALIVIGYSDIRRF